MLQGSNVCLPLHRQLLALIEETSGTSTTAGKLNVIEPKCPEIENNP